MTLALTTVPGFNDLSSVPLQANKFSIGVHISAINANASFGLVRLEIFTGVYAHGDTVALPVSPVDGYTYQRSELMYLWVPANTADQKTGWASYREPWTMWYGIWNVDQTTGEVSSEIGYRGNNDHKDRQATTNDGIVQVFVIAQRQKTGLIMSASPSFVRHPDTDFYVNRALNTSLISDLNKNAKFSIVNTEIIYCGEFFNGQTVPQPVSPVDGHVYAYADCWFQTSWRWTTDTDGSGNPIKPAINKGQLQDWSASVTTSGLVKIANTAVAYELSGTHSYTTGKVAVFAFCNRALGTTFPASVNLFSEVTDDKFAPGSSLRASTLKQVNRNINQAVCTPEFFAPANYNNGATIPLPTSPLDGYTYARSELFYIWDWANTGPSVFASGRLSLVHGGISAAGVVTISDYRLNSGASSVSLAHEGAMRVVVVGFRSRTLASPPVAALSPPGFGSDDVADFQGNLDDIPDGTGHIRPLVHQLDYLNSVGQISLSTALNPQGSIVPNQTITLTFTMPSPGTLLLITWLQQSLLRPDNTTLTLLSSTGTNLVVNGDFEAAGTVGAQAANWSLLGGNALVKDNSAIHAGSFNGKINNAGGATSQNASTASIALTGGQVYVLEAWIKVGTAMPNIPAHAGAVVDLIIGSGIGSYTIYTKFGAWEGGSTTTPRIGWPADGATHAYGFFQCFFKPASSGNIQINCIMQSNGGDSEWDDIRLYPFLGGLYNGLSNSTGYYIYPYIEVATGLLKFANGAPPPTSPSDTFQMQAQFDGRIGVPVKKVITPSAGNSGTDTGGGDGTCPEKNELVWVRVYDDEGYLNFEGVVEAFRVGVGFESDDGKIRRGWFIKGWSFSKLEYVYRAVCRIRHVPCAGWSKVNGRMLTPCEAVWWDAEQKWLPAWKTPGAEHINLVSEKVDIEVEADWDDEHNYVIVDEHGIVILIIHNSFVLPC
jgi:hypothetical protein